MSTSTRPRARGADPPPAPDDGPLTVHALGAALGRALAHTLRSTSEADRIGEPANVVDGLYALARAVEHVADAMRGEPKPAPKEPTE